MKAWLVFLLFCSFVTSVARSQDSAAVRELDDLLTTAEGTADPDQKKELLRTARIRAASVGDSWRALQAADQEITAFQCGEEEALKLRVETLKAVNVDSPDAPYERVFQRDFDIKTGSYGEYMDYEKPFLRVIGELCLKYRFAETQPFWEKLQKISARIGNRIGVGDNGGRVRQHELGRGLCRNLERAGIREMAAMLEQDQLSPSAQFQVGKGLAVYCGDMKQAARYLCILKTASEDPWPEFGKLAQDELDFWEETDPDLLQSALLRARWKLMAEKVPNRHKKLCHAFMLSHYRWELYLLRDMVEEAEQSGASGKELSKLISQRAKRVWALKDQEEAGTAFVPDFVTLKGMLFFDVYPVKPNSSFPPESLPPRLFVRESEWKKLRDKKLEEKSKEPSESVSSPTDE